MRSVSGVARFVAAAPVCFFVALQAPAQETPVDPDSLSKPAIRFPLQWNGFATGQYAYDFGSDENSFDATALNLSVFKAFSDRVSFFGQLAVHLEDETVFAGEEKSSASVDTDIDNLQIAWAASPRHGLQLVFGKFDSPLTLERDDAPLNLEATRSFLFEFGEPIKFTGLMARQTFSPQFEAYAILANGWDVFPDNNKAKTGAVYGVWSPWPIAHFGLGAVYGAEKDDRNGDHRATAVATIQVQQTDTWLWGEQFVYGREPHSGEDGGTAEWFADEFFTHHRLGRHWAVTARVEYFDDIGGSRTGRRQILRSFTVSPQYLLGSGFFGLYRTLDRSTLRIPELTLRLDLRYDHSTERVFPDRQGEGRTDRFSTTLQAVYVF
ncbi:MAG: outer membrane beta-barrel protein [Acidobacteriota bacterium]